MFIAERQREANKQRTGEVLFDLGVCMYVRIFACNAWKRSLYSHCNALRIVTSTYAFMHARMDTGNANGLRD